MKKIILILLSAATLFAAPRTTKQNPINIDDEKAMSHINYIQYSLNKIRYSKSKATINAELDAILNTINPTSLKYDALIEAYQELTQSTLMGLKLNIEQEEALQAEINNKRKNAVYSMFGDLSTGISIAATVPNPVSIGMVALQAGFNYARTQGEITDDSLKQANKLDAEATRIIDVERTGIFLSAAKVFKDKNYENTHFINETMMKSLSQITFELDYAAKLDSMSLKTDDYGNLKNIHKIAIKAITYLSEDDVYNLFEFFLPYHLTLLKAHYYLTEIDPSNYQVMDSIFDKIVEISNTNYRRFYQKNEFLKEAAQYMILAKMQSVPYADNSSKIGKYISYMENNIQATLENKINQKFFLTSVYEYLNRHDQIRECLDYIYKVGAEPEMGTELMRIIYANGCDDPNSESCQNIKITKEEQEKLLKRQEYTDEANKLLKKIKMSNKKNTWTLESPIALTDVKAECFAADDRADPSDAKKCNDEMNALEEFHKSGLYRYNSLDYFRHRESIFVKFSFFVKDKEGKWGFFGELEQTSEDGNFKANTPEILFYDGASK